PAPPCADFSESCASVVRARTRTRPAPNFGRRSHLRSYLTMNPSVTRRHFLKSATVASASTLAFPAILRSQEAGVPAQSPNNRLNIAYVGVGGRGWDAVDGLKGEN